MSRIKLHINKDIDKDIYKDIYSERDWKTEYINKTCSIYPAGFIHNII